MALIRDARDVNEYAFALGALGHYSADNDGHPIGRQPCCCHCMYPKLKKEFGNRVTYAQSPKNHVLVEFSFDVVQVAAAACAGAYHAFIGFRVAKPLLERAFSETHGIEMKDIFFSEDLAIGTCRHAVATTIPG